MRTTSKKSIDRLGKILKSRSKEISLGELARKLGVTYPTAKRWFELWAKDNDYESGYQRRGSRGPEAFVVRAV